MLAYAPEPPPFKDPIFGAIKYYLNFAFCEKTRYVGVQSNYHTQRRWLVFVGAGRYAD